VEIAKEVDRDLMQLMYIEQGVILVDRLHETLKLNPPILLCLNHTEPADHVSIQDGKGFSILFKPDVVNHSLGTGGAGQAKDRSWSLNHVLVEPFRISGRDNPVYLSADLHLQKRILSIHDNLGTQLVDQPDGFWPCRGRSFFLELMVLMQSFWGQKTNDDRGFILPKGNQMVEGAAREACLAYPDPYLGVRSLASSPGVPRGELKRAFRKTMAWVRWHIGPNTPIPTADRPCMRAAAKCHSWREIRSSVRKSAVLEVWAVLTT
jgi:hypothetical protein